VQHEIGTRLARLVIAELGKEPVAQPVRLMVLRYCLGMIMSVSTLIIGKCAAMAVSVVNFCMQVLVSLHAM